MNNEENVLVCSYLNNNLGDDLFLRVLKEKINNKNIYCLAMPGTDITHLNNSLGLKCVKYNKFEKKIDQYTYLLFKKTLFLSKIIKRFNYTVILGGSMFIEHKKWMNNFIIFHELICSKYSKSYVIGTNFGPYTSNEFLRNYRKLLRQASYVTFRDKYSKRTVGVNCKNIDFAPDVIFNMDVSKYLKNSKKNKVGISVIDLGKKGNISRKSDAYIFFIKRTIKLFLKMNFEVDLFSFCEKEGDLALCKKLAKNNENIKIVNYSDDIDSFLYEFCSCEYHLATRFHSMILGFLSGKKVLPLAYSEKTINVIKDFNRNLSYIDINDLNVNTKIDLTFFNKETNFDNEVRESKKHFEFLT